MFPLCHSPSEMLILGHSLDSCRVSI